MGLTKQAKRKPASQGARQPAGNRVTAHNVPGYTSTVDAGMHYAMTGALHAVLPPEAPGLTQGEPSKPLRWYKKASR